MTEQQYQTFSNVIISSNENTAVVKLNGSHSKKAIRKRCWKYKNDYEISGYVSAYDNTNRIVVSVL
jgi:hypothetical protein